MWVAILALGVNYNFEVWMRWHARIVKSQPFHQWHVHMRGEYTELDGFVLLCFRASCLCRLRHLMLIIACILICQLHVLLLLHVALQSRLDAIVISFDKALMWSKPIPGWLCIIYLCWPQVKQFIHGNHAEGPCVHLHQLFLLMRL